ncbi:MAG: type II toxin-antitoxin system VapC family toxin [Lentisphaerae bacterium]|nr:type II toxin-antitoxin system VapC family toxin [Lentisphaerota bacterium]
MILYFDACYLVRLYVEDRGFESVRALAASAHLACAAHGEAETLGAIHRKFREHAFTASQYRHIVDQFHADCRESAFRWLPLSSAVMARLHRVYATLPATLPLRAADALHLACASENGFREIYSNDHRLLAAAAHFDIKGVDAMSA